MLLQITPKRVYLCISLAVCSLATGSTKVVDECTELNFGGVSTGFGRSVAIHEDVAVVGKISQFTCDADGRAYVFQRSPTDSDTWVLFANLVANDSTTNGFGHSVAVYGDTIVIGAISAESNEGTDCAGAVYLFGRNQGGQDNWGQVAKLSVSNPDAQVGDWLGFTVAIWDDTIAASAPSADGADGAVYVFSRPSSGWADAEETAKLTRSGSPVDNWLGYFPGLDVHGDTILAESHNENSSTGSAYIYIRPTGGWVDATQNARIDASDGQDGDEFSYGLGLFNDRVIIGAFGDDDAGSYAGSAYYFRKPHNGWSNSTNETHKIIPTDIVAGATFGVTVSVAEDWAVIGAGRYEDLNGNKFAAVYTYHFDGFNGWRQQNRLDLPNDNQGDPAFHVDVSGSSAIVGDFGLGRAFVCKLALDCNGNDVDDSNEVAGGTSDDCNTNGVPDECDPDCNTNGTPEECEGAFYECSGNPSTSACPNADVNCNGSANILDIAVVTSPSNWQKFVCAAGNARADVNRDGVVDELDVDAIRNPECWQH